MSATNNAGRERDANAAVGEGTVIAVVVVVVVYIYDTRESLVIFPFSVRFHCLFVSATDG